MFDYSTEIEKSQDDKLQNELETRFAPKKEAALLLSHSYKRLGSGYEGKAARVADCGGFLEFWRLLEQLAEQPPEGWKLHQAYFCTDRLCPMCQFRRSLKTFAQVFQVVEALAADYEFLLLTLTVPNCEPQDLGKTITAMQGGWGRLRRTVRFENGISGYFKSLEVTINRNKSSSSYGTYHPHFHNILAVRRGTYFETSAYISQAEWLDLWRRSVRDSSIAQVDIRKLKPKELYAAMSTDQRKKSGVKSLASAVAEVAKYSVKPSGYLGKFDKETGRLIQPFPDDVIDDAVYWLSVGLKNRRLTEFRGIFKDMHERLCLDDNEDGDLIHIDGSGVSSDLLYLVRRYGYQKGAYKLLEELVSGLEGGEVYEA